MRGSDVTARHAGVAGFSHLVRTSDFLFCRFHVKRFVFLAAQVRRGIERYTKLNGGVLPRMALYLLCSVREHRAQVPHRCAVVGKVVICNCINNVSFRLVGVFKNQAVKLVRGNGFTNIFLPLTKTE